MFFRFQIFIMRNNDSRFVKTALETGSIQDRKQARKRTLQRKHRYRVISDRNPKMKAVCSEGHLRIDNWLQ